MAPSGNYQYIDIRKITDFSKEILCDGLTTENKGCLGKKSNSKKVIVTSENVTKRKTVTKKVDNYANVRKTKVYQNVAEIVADIEAGRIVPYQTNDEVIGDVSRGLITPSQAVLFLSELVKRKRFECAAAISDAVSRDINKRVGNSSNDNDNCKGRIPVADVDDEDIVEDEESEESEEQSRDDDFGDADGGYKSSDAEWRPDDNW